MYQPWEDNNLESPWLKPSSGELLYAEKHGYWQSQEDTPSQAYERPKRRILKIEAPPSKDKGLAKHPNPSTAQPGAHQDLCSEGQEVSELPTSPWELGAGLHKSSADSSASQPSLVPPRQMQPQEVAPNSARAAASANEVPQFVPRAVRQAQRQPAESHFEVTAAKVVWALQKYFKESGQEAQGSVSLAALQKKCADLLGTSLGTTDQFASKLRDAARAGHSHAQYFIASLLESGELTEVAGVAAVFWYSAAANKGFQPAADRLAMLKESAGKIEREGSGILRPGAQEFVPSKPAEHQERPESFTDGIAVQCLPPTHPYRDPDGPAYAWSDGDKDSHSLQVDANSDSAHPAGSCAGSGGEGSSSAIDDEIDPVYGLHRLILAQLSEQAKHELLEAKKRAAKLLPAARSLGSGTPARKAELASGTASKEGSAAAHAAAGNKAGAEAASDNEAAPAVLPAEKHSEEEVLPSGDWEAALKADSVNWIDAPEGGSEWREQDPCPKYPVSSYSVVSYELSAAGQGTPAPGSMAELTEAADLCPPNQQPDSQAEPQPPQLAESDITAPSLAVVKDDYMRQILGLPPSGTRQAEPADADAPPHKPGAAQNESEAVTAQLAALSLETAAISSEPAAVKVRILAAPLYSNPAAQQGTGSSATEVATNAEGDKTDEHIKASSSAQPISQEASQKAKEEPSENLGPQHAPPKEGRPQGPAASSGEVTPSEDAQHGTEERHLGSDSPRMEKTAASSSNNAIHGTANAAGGPGLQEQHQIKVDAREPQVDFVAEDHREGSPASESAAQSQPLQGKQSAENFGSQQPGAHASTPAATTEGNPSSNSFITPDAVLEPNAAALQAAATEAQPCASSGAAASTFVAPGSTVNTTAAKAMPTGGNELAGKGSANGVVLTSSQNSSSLQLTSLGSVGSDYSNGEAVKDAAEGGTDVPPTETQNAGKLGAEPTAPSEMPPDKGGANATVVADHPVKQKLQSNPEAVPAEGLENKPISGQQDKSTKAEANGNASCIQEAKPAAQRNLEGLADSTAATSMDHSEEEQAESALLPSRMLRSSLARRKVRSPVAPPTASPAASLGPENFAARSNSANAMAQLTLSERWSQDSLADAISAAQQVRLEDVPAAALGLSRLRPSKRLLPLPVSSQGPEAPPEAAVEARAKESNSVNGGRTTEVAPLDQKQAPRKAAAIPPPGFEISAHAAQQQASALPPAATLAPPPLPPVKSQPRLEASPQCSSPPGDDLQSILDVLLPGLQEPAVDSKAPCRVPVVQEPETKGKAPKSPLTEEGILQKDVAASVAAMDKLFGPPQAPLATAGDTLPPLHRTVGKQVSDANGTMDATSSATGVKQQQQQGYAQAALEERKKTKAKRDMASVLDDIFSTGSREGKIDLSAPIAGSAAMQSAAKRGLAVKPGQACGPTTGALKDLPRAAAASRPAPMSAGGSHQARIPALLANHQGQTSSTSRQPQASFSANKCTPSVSIAAAAPPDLARFKHLLICPLSKQLMTDPVYASNGSTYERSAIEHHLHRFGTDPETQMPMDKVLKPNVAAKRMLEMLGPNVRQAE